MSIGIDHLDNLVRLMEQLSSLKEENVSLRKKCSYLQDTKTLLQVLREKKHTKKKQTEKIAIADLPKILIPGNFSHIN